MKMHKILGCIVIILSVVGVYFIGTLNNKTYATSESTKKERSISFSKTEKTVKLGKTLSYSARRKGITSKEKISYSSSDTNVATVDEKGKITTVAKGKTTITASCGELSASYELTVLPDKVWLTMDDSDEKINGTVVLAKDEQVYFSLKDIEGEISDDEVTWKSSKENIAKVDEKGLVTTLENGNANINASLTEYPKSYAKVKVLVDTPVESISTNEDSVTTYIKDTANITTNILPETATNTKLKYTVEDKSVASVSNKGVVRGKSEGVTNVVITSVSNPEISTTVEIVVKAERDYIVVKSTEVEEENPISLSSESVSVDVDDTVTIVNEYGKNAKFTTNDKKIIDVSSNDELITIKGKKEGSATINVSYEDTQDTIKVVCGKYIENDSSDSKDKNTKFDKEHSIQEIMPALEDDNEVSDYVNKNPLEVGVATEIDIRIFPVTADVSDMKLELSNYKDFKLENGRVTAINPNKTTNLIVSSKTNPKAKKNIKLKSTIGNVESVRFAKDYVDNNKFNINLYKKYDFNPVFVMESGKVYDPVSDPEIVNDEIYKALRKNVKITCEDENIVDITSANELKPKEGVDGTGILKIEYNKSKNSNSSDSDYEISSTARFEVVGKVIEKIKKISFVKNSYDLANGQTWSFNPKITLSSNRVLDPTEEGVANSEEYKDFLNQIQLLNVPESNKYKETAALVLFRNRADGTTENSIDAVYEGECKLRIAVVGNEKIYDDTILNIKSPYVISNIQSGTKVKKVIEDFRYVNTDSLKVTSDVSGTNEEQTISRGAEIWVYEKYDNGYVRISYNGNSNLYVEAKFLATKKEQTQRKTTSSNINNSSRDNSGSRNNDSSSSSNSGSGSGSSSNGNSNSSGDEGYEVAKEINASRWVTGSNVNVRTKPSTQGSSVAKLNKNAQVYVTKKYTNGWCKIKTDSGVEGYMTSEYLTDEDPSNVKSSSKKNSSQSTKNSTKSSSNSSGVRLMYPKNNNIPLYYLQGDKLYGYKERVTIYQAFNVFFETNIKGESYYYTETNINGKTLSCYVRTVSLH